MVIEMDDLMNFFDCAVRFKLGNKLFDTHPVIATQRALVKTCQSMLRYMKLGDLERKNIPEILNNMLVLHDITETAYTKQRGILKASIKKAIMKAYWFYDTVGDLIDKEKLISIQEDYQIRIEKDIFISGTIDLISCIKKPKSYFPMVLDSRKFGIGEKGRTLPTVLGASLAYRHLFKAKESFVVHFNLFNEHKNRHRILDTDLIHLGYLCDMFQKAHEQKIFLPNFRFSCATCPVIKECNGGGWIEDDFWKRKRWDTIALRRQGKFND